MKRRILSFTLVLALLVTLTPPTSAAETVTPIRPSWITDEEYVIYQGSTAYEPQTWKQLLDLRVHAESGALEPQSGTETVLYNQLRKLSSSKDPGVRFEVALLQVKYAMNAAAQGKPEKIGSDFESAAYYSVSQPQFTAVCRLWNARTTLWQRDITTGLEGKDLGFVVGAIEPLLRDPDFTISGLLDCALLKDIPQEQIEALKSQIFVTLDGIVVHPRTVYYHNSRSYDTTIAQSQNDRTMVPIRRLAELMGAVVSYDAATNTITIERAADRFVMTLGSTTALKNGTAFEMDVAPFAENSRTYIPIRYIAEFFGQKVEWRPEQQHVAITEDRDAVAPSNLEAWTLAMCAVLNKENNNSNKNYFGGKTRFGIFPVGSPVTTAVETTGPDFGRKILADGWGIESREDLMEKAAAHLSYAQQYPAWHCFRMGTLAQWGYLAGYVTFPEALTLVEPAAKILRQKYSSWDEAYKAYLFQYYNWPEASDGQTDIWQTPRGEIYQKLKEDPATGFIFDDSLFTAPVIGVPKK